MTNNSKQANSGAAEQNTAGKDARSPRTRDTLRYPFADVSPFRRIAVNSAKTDLDRSALIEIQELLFPKIVDQISEVKSTELSLHHFTPANVASESYDQLAGVSSFTSPITTHDQLQQRQLAAASLAKGRASTLLDEIAQVVRNALSMRVQAIEASLDRTAQTAPFELTKCIQQVREHLAEVGYPEAEFEGLNNLAGLLNLSSTVRNDATTVPESKQEPLLAAAYRAALPPCKSVLKDVIATLVQKEFKRSSVLLTQKLDNLEAMRGSHMLRDAIETLNRTNRTETASLAGILDIPGPSKRVMLKELCRLYRCDPASLPVEIGRALLEHLHEQVVEGGHIDAPAQWGAVLELTTVGEIIAAFSRLTEEALKVHNVYAAIRGFGITETAAQLDRLAEPFIALNRDHLTFNVEITSSGVLYAPAPQTEADRKTLERIQSSLEQRYRGLKLVLQDAGKQHVRLVKSIAGFSAAIESVNDDLFDFYVRSHQLGHACHLFDVIPDSTNGMASTVAIELAQQLYG
ncbi:MAG: hypothetical protein AAF497_02310 [Planctomycetota bacterium]